MHVLVPFVPLSFARFFISFVPLSFPRERILNVVDCITCFIEYKRYIVYVYILSHYRYYIELSEPLYNVCSWNARWNFRFVVRFIPKQLMSSRRRPCVGTVHNLVRRDTCLSLFVNTTPSWFDENTYTWHVYLPFWMPTVQYRFAK